MKFTFLLLVALGTLMGVVRGQSAAKINDGVQLRYTLYIPHKEFIEYCQDNLGSGKKPIQTAQDAAVLLRTLQHQLIKSRKREAAEIELWLESYANTEMLGEKSAIVFLQHSVNPASLNLQRSRSERDVLKSKCEEVYKEMKVVANTTNSARSSFVTEFTDDKAPAILARLQTLGLLDQKLKDLGKCYEESLKKYREFLPCYEEGNAIEQFVLNRENRKWTDFLLNKKEIMVCAIGGAKDLQKGKVVIELKNTVLQTSLGELGQLATGLGIPGFQAFGLGMIEKEIVEVAKAHVEVSENLSEKKEEKTDLETKVAKTEKQATASKFRTEKRALTQTATEQKAEARRIGDEIKKLNEQKAKLEVSLAELTRKVLNPIALPEAINFEKLDEDLSAIPITFMVLNTDEFRAPATIRVQGAEIKEELSYEIHERNKFAVTVGVAANMLNERLFQPNDQKTELDISAKDTQTLKSSLFALLDYCPAGRVLERMNFVLDKDPGVPVMSPQRFSLVGGVKLSKDPLEKIYMGIGYALSRGTRLTAGFLYARVPVEKTVAITPTTSLDYLRDNADREYKPYWFFGVTVTPGSMIKTLGLGKK